MVTDSGDGHREGRAVGSVIIPAHDEATVIERCLASLSRGAGDDPPTVVVACNGCTDETAAIAKASDAVTEVIELARPSKTAAINAAEELGLSLPRIYLDADVELTATAARDVIRALDDGAVAARPPLRYRTEGASWVVRSYYRARSRTPSLLGRLWGAGVYGLSAEGRRRFGPYPDVVGEDLWVDEHFGDEEIVVVDTDPVVVRVPLTARALLRTLRRTQRGRMEHHRSTAEAGDADLHTTPTGTFRAVVGTARSGWLAAADAAVYVLVAVWSRVLARLAPAGAAWERDDTSRTAEAPGLPREGTGP
jgi:hypothetical protein